MKAAQNTCYDYYLSEFVVGGGSIPEQISDEFIFAELYGRREFDFW